jgi:hypothetical protein
MQTLLSGLATVGEAMLLALAVPLAILAVGTPVVLLVRLGLEVARAL